MHSVKHDKVIVTFDLLELDGADVRSRPIEERKQHLAAVSHLFAQSISRSRRNGWCFRVFHLEPLVGAASTVGRAKSLAHNAFTARLSSAMRHAWCGRRGKTKTPASGAQVQVASDAFVASGCRFDILLNRPSSRRLIFYCETRAASASVPGPSRIEGSSAEESRSQPATNSCPRPRLGPPRFGGFTRACIVE